MPEQQVVVASKQHLVRLINAGHTEFDLRIDGMGVPENRKTIKYNNFHHTFKVTHHLTGITVPLNIKQLDDTFKTQIGAAISKKKLIALKQQHA